LHDTARLSKGLIIRRSKNKANIVNETSLKEQAYVILIDQFRVPNFYEENFR